MINRARLYGHRSAKARDPLGWYVREPSGHRFAMPRGSPLSFTPEKSTLSHIKITQTRNNFILIHIIFFH